MIQHVLTFFKLFDLPLQLLRLALGPGGDLRRLLHIVPILFQLRFRHAIVDGCFDHAVDHQIRIAADRRSKMAIISERKAKMPVTFRAVISLLHRPQYHSVDDRLIRLVSDRVNDIRQGFRIDIVRISLQMDTKIHQESL